MPLPPEQIEQLLNEYLDDALSGERLATVEAAVAENPALSLRLGRLRDERAERLEAFRDDPRFRNVRLSPDFTQRVVEAAAAAASARPLPHPAAPAPAMAGTRRWLRPLAIVAGIAAAVLIAVSLFPKQHAEPNPGPGLAEATRPSVTGEGLASVAVPDAIDPVVDTPSAMAEVQAVDIVATPRVTPEAADPVAPVQPDAVMPEAAAPSEIAQAMVPEAGVAAPDAVPDLAPSAAADPGSSISLDMVMVYEVTRTARGKSNTSVMEALQKAGIDVEARRPVGEDVVGYLQQAKLLADDQSRDQRANNQRASVLYVEASGKALDRFMVSMFTDTDNIAQLRWNVATDPPLVAAMKKLQQVSAPDVQHAEDSSTAWRLVSGEGDGEQLDFAVHADARPLMPLKREGWNAMGSSNQGPDIQSRLILLVR